MDQSGVAADAAGGVAEAVQEMLLDVASELYATDRVVLDPSLYEDAVRTERVTLTATSSITAARQTAHNPVVRAQRQASHAMMIARKPI